ncbi:MAG: Nramp family divalent metal transporter [Anaerolineae bacterium]|nr:Nramp family divalent metal transporter [Anaerolineae bacterium]
MEHTGVVQEAPQGWKRLVTLGPGIIWAASAVGVSELVFATRAGALYGLALLWAPLVSLFIKYFMTEMVGAYTIATGENAVTAFSRVEVRVGRLRLLPRGWILWLLWVLFIFSVAGMAGCALAVGAALYALVPALPFAVWSLLALAVVGIILFWGSYGALTQVSRALVAVMVFFVFYAVAQALPPVGEVLSGLVPQVPAGSPPELIPLLGWTGAGAVGTVWFSMWAQASNRGMAGKKGEPAAADLPRIRDWIRINRMDLIISTVITAILTAGFLTAGAVILRPLGTAPEGDALGIVLSQIAGEHWGRTGEVIFLLGVLGTLFSTLLANIDGICRVAAGAIGFYQGRKELPKQWYHIFLGIYILTSALLAFVVRAPVFMLQVTAAVDTTLIPIIAVMAIYICRKYLPAEFRPGRLTLVMTYVCAVFFVFFIALLVVAIVSGVRFASAG